MIEKELNKLSKSKFRNSFHLKERDIEYIKNKDINQIREHEHNFIIKRISPKIIENDGKQTPFKGHPVFIAQHACACCCRSCLYKWHKMPQNIELNDKQIEYIVNLIIAWIQKEMNNFQ